jgi:putative transposase
MTLYNNKYRIESNRLKDWNYSSNAMYFVTICTDNFRHYFGEISEQKGQFIMNFSETGKMALEFWSEIPKHYPFVILDAFIVMPNHVHGIILIDKKENISSDVETQYFASQNKNKNLHDVETQNIASLPIHGGNRFGPQSQNLASIIRGFKIGVTKFCKQNRLDFCWQDRYYDHIIRDNTTLIKIQNYIEYNTDNWKKDKFYNR